MKATWAVACATIGVLGILATGPGCSANSSSLSGEAGEGLNRENAQLAKVASKMEKPPPVSQSDYRIGAEDVLRVSVWDNRDLTVDVTVRPDGKISLPLIRDVQAANSTATELAEMIRNGLLTYIKDPQVSIMVMQVNAPKIFVIGNVARPGPYPLRSEMSALQVLSLAGGFTQFASPRSIKIVRGVGPKQEVRKINFYDMIDDEGVGNYIMKAGDTLVIP